MDNSKIEWTTHTFNPWIGCAKVSAGCKNCYAEALDHRWNKGRWGINAPRTATSKANWNKPFRWNKAAQEAGRKDFVFCASMADVFEDHPHIPDLRNALFKMIESTPNLVWQLLTKRPENIMRFVPESWKNKFPDNVWVGTSVENQEAADIRIQHLINIPSVVRFLSCEPLIGAVDLTRVKAAIDPYEPEETYFFNCLNEGYYYEDEMGSAIDGPGRDKIDWVIVGGESGPRARPMHPDWVEKIKGDCVGWECAFFFKQWGEWKIFYDRDKDDPDWRIIPKDSPNTTMINLAGGSGFHGDRVVYFKKLGKKNSGRTLNDQLYSEFPNQK